MIICASGARRNAFLHCAHLSGFLQGQYVQSEQEQKDHCAANAGLIASWGSLFSPHFLDFQVAYILVL